MAIIGLDLPEFCDAKAFVRFHGTVTLRNSPPVGQIVDAYMQGKHARRAAAGIVDTPLVRREPLDQHSDHAARRVELPAVLSLGIGELREEVFVDAAQDVLRAVLGTNYFFVAGGSSFSSMSHARDCSCQASHIGPL